MAEQTVMVPEGLSPRSAFGYMLMPLIRSFGAVNANSINEAYRKLLDTDEDNSEEQQIAKEIFAKKAIPVIYGMGPYKAIAYRWKTQINENSKLLAYASSFPELNHNDTMALHGTYRKKEFYFMAFTDGLNRRIEDRIEATEKLTNTKLVRIKATGNSPFARAMHILHKGDYVSYHLALLRGMDPSDITVIKDLKKTLGGK